ncbi:Hypothetical predicted protein [Paramuricea clavata]|uniref:Uncharacterized protein n=1 Tax=Paramuricea clavata TaxID=317549 RepID=A0A6S7JHE7_PARCT|nr:Hypothetical predicted protein [Paramuricea clavata]
MEVFFQLPHCEINENVLRDVQNKRDVLKSRITHIIDCEAYTWRKNNFLREVSVLCRATNIVTTYQIYIPNVTLFDENDRAVRYQIRVIHSLPIKRRRIDNNFYLYSEIVAMLRKIFQDADLVGYKGGNIGLRNLALFDYLDGKYPRCQVDKVLPYQFEPKLGLQTSDSGDESDSEEQSESSDEEITKCLRSKMLGAFRIEAKGY